jgi:hypothetical protein
MVQVQLLCLLWYELTDVGRGRAAHFTHGSRASTPQLSFIQWTEETKVEITSELCVILYILIISRHPSEISTQTPKSSKDSLLSSHRQA